MRGIVLVTPLSTEDGPIEATARTIERILPPGAHRCRRGDWGAPILKDGCLIVDSSDTDFLIFAVKQQGYGLDATVYAPLSPDLPQAHTGASTPEGSQV